MFQRDLIFDLGMHNGTDTEFYLKKGFRVVGVEANPLLADAAKLRFAPEITKRILSIENFGVHIVDSVLTFYINEEVDEWSSFEKHLGARQNTRFKAVEIPCRRLDYFIGKYGMPYYLKIDIEGVDSTVTRELTRWATRPMYVSVEDGGIDSLIALYETGVRRFKFINQIAIRDYVLPVPALEGHTVEHRFAVGSSGPFGGELPGEWLPPDQAFQFYGEHVRPPGQPPIDGWWDIHGWYYHAH
jgi:FkbM family methyltransferase